MAQIPQPFSIRWSPSTGPTDPPSWESIGRVADGTVDRGRGPGFFDAYAPGTARCKVRNGNTAESATHDIGTWNRWKQLQVVTSHTGSPRPVFTGFVTQFDHDLSDAPFASIVDVVATDADAVWNRQSISRDSNGDPVPAGMLGFGPYTVAELAAEVNVGGAAPTVDSVGVARAPVSLPASINTDAGITYARFRENARSALRKALDVEVGTAHIAADGSLAVNGRYTIADVVSGGGDPTAFVLTDNPAVIDNTFYFPFVRGSVRFADPIAEYRNGATTAGLQKKTHTFTTAAADTDGIDDLIERLDLWCDNERWVDANAHLLGNLYAGVRYPWPSEVSVVVWNTAMVDFALLEAVCDASDTLGRSVIALVFTPPGGTEESYAATVEGIRWTITSTQVIATLKLGVSASRWANAYDLSTGIFALDTPGRGLDSGALLGP